MCMDGWLDRELTMKEWTVEENFSSTLYSSRKKNDACIQWNSCLGDGYDQIEKQNKTKR